MTAIQNPALDALVAEIKPELVFAQVFIRRIDTEFELRHVGDRDTAAEELNLISESEIRALVQFTLSGGFRPLKSAPNLRAGWRYVASSETKLEFALNTFYPSAVADWFAVRSGNPPVTNYRAFTNRQTGMYRIATMLTDAQAAPMIRACCHKNFCLKQRLWTVEGLLPDTLEETSLIPCLEPCAILLEFARKAMRLEQEKARGEIVAQSDETKEPTPSEIREADFENPNNPRRIQLEIEKQNMA